MEARGSVDFTPSHAHQRSVSSPSSSTSQLRSPTSPTPTLTPSPTASSISTPPSSLRQYASAIHASMAKGMKTAVADMRDDARESERQFDKEFGYSDEDPIDRYVKLFLTPRPRKSVVPAAAAAARISGLPNGSGHGQLGLGIEIEDAEDLDHELNALMQEPEKPLADAEKAFRPGLIQFHRTHSSQSSRKGIPSFGHGMTSDEGPTSAESSPFGNGMDTPGSEWSEASFEAIKPEDVMSLYGSSVGSSIDFSRPRPPLPAVHVDHRASTVSTVSTVSTMSSMSTITSLSTASGASGGSDSTAKPVRPGMGRPRPRASANPYPYSGERERDAGDAGQRVGQAGSREREQEEEDWLSGRTVSEQMVAQAGIRCQRGRAGLRR